MYIVFDLEWNQCTEGRDKVIPGLPFEIIEIGAVKLDESLNIVDKFYSLINPAVYKRLHFKVSEVVKITMDELQQGGRPFTEVIEEFLKFCGDDPMFCTWGETDLVQLQRNMTYHGVKEQLKFPLLYYDLQKLYSRLYKNNIKPAPPLDEAVAYFNIETDGPFHRALDDAIYTARVMKAMDFESVKAYTALDYYRIPKAREEEIHLTFPEYTKDVYRAFNTKDDLIEDKEAMDMMCVKCRRLLKKRVRWFTASQKQYLCVAYCPVHGYVKGKIRIKVTDDGKTFPVKTCKLINEEDATVIAMKKQDVSRMKAEKRRRRKRR